ncbi:MAG TPA: VOC family protein [Candidatus Bathyarchaeia archaeon]|nr:VOC family protein [Candidatus Bathyarchaeia archaeon]
MSDATRPAQGVDVGGFLRGPAASPPEPGSRVPARVSFVTLAVRDFERMAKFYRQFGWPESKDSNDDFVAFQTGGAILGLFPTKYYASLGEAPAAGAFKGFELAMNLDDAAQVDRVYAALNSFADLRLQGPPRDLSIGGRAFSFLDPEGNAWEVIWKSGTSFDERGGLIFP